MNMATHKSSTVHKYLPTLSKGKKKEAKEAQLRKAFKKMILVAFLSLVMLPLRSKARGIATYWGQNGNEGTLVKLATNMSDII